MALADIKAFCHMYSHITAASDWPRHFLHPRYFCLAWLIQRSKVKISKCNFLQLSKQHTVSHSKLRNFIAGTRPLLWWMPIDQFFKKQLVILNSCWFENYSSPKSAVHVTYIKYLPRSMQTKDYRNIVYKFIKLEQLLWAFLMTTMSIYT